MRAKILCIQFRTKQDLIEQERACIERWVGVYADLGYADALSDDFSWTEPAVLLDGYQGVILGGSSEYYFDGGCATDDPAVGTTNYILDKLSPLFAYLLKHDIPTLGICYGHQLLGAFAGAKVTNDQSQQKTCSHQVSLLIGSETCPLLVDMPESFFAHYGHKDSLDRIPEGAVSLLDGGARCLAPALRYGENVFTTQFHPELTYEDLVLRLNSAAEYLPEGMVVSDIFKSDTASNKILENFGKFVTMKG